MNIFRKSTRETTWTLDFRTYSKMMDNINPTLSVQNSRGKTITYNQSEIDDLWKTTDFSISKNGTHTPIKIIQFI